MDKVVRKLNIELTKDKAFHKFIKELNEWWPKEYTWSQDKLKEIKIDGKKDGLCTEIGPYGFRCDWGRVTTITENEFIGLKWQISSKREPIPNPDNASDIKITFTNSGGGTTTLVFEHYNFENHGKEGVDYQKMMDGEYGWDFILDKFKKYSEI